MSGAKSGLPPTADGDHARARPSGRPATDPQDTRSLALDRALDRLAEWSSDHNAKDAILYGGNAHDSIPRRLYLDRRLSPLERNAWSLVRIGLQGHGVNVMPSYAALRPYLTTAPYAMQASEETVARALTVLRLTRWLSLVRRRRDPVTGRFEGSLYVLHDEPLTPYEALQLDVNYLEVVGRSLTHASKAVQATAREALREIAEDPRVEGRILPPRVALLIERLSAAGSPAGDQIGESAHDRMSDEANAGVADRSDSSRPQPDLRSDGADPSPASDSEDGPPALVGRLRNPKPDSTVRTVRTEQLNNEIRTVPRAREGTSLRLPGRLSRLRTEQCQGALNALRQVEADLQQLVLDEWDLRCETSRVRNPAAYLFGLIQRALRGEFRAWASRPAEKPPESGLGNTAAAGSNSGSLSQQTQLHIAALMRQMKVR